MGWGTGSSTISCLLVNTRDQAIIVIDSRSPGEHLPALITHGIEQLKARVSRGEYAYI